MVFDLEQIKSHPDKLLKTHIEGVKGKASRNDNSVITELAALFHDLGKINPNFQSKLKGTKNTGYSQHSYISAFCLLNWYVKNRDEATKRLNIEGQDFTNLKIVLTIILHHHGNLPNLDNNIVDGPYQEMVNYLESNSRNLNVSDFLINELNFNHTTFDLSIKGWYKNKIPNLDIGNEHESQNWQKNALQNFLKTQYSFASLIEADKRDASNNEFYYQQDNIEQYKSKLEIALNETFNRFDSFSKKSELNRLRTNIRNEAIQSIFDYLATGERIFTLTAPTGAGKTYTLLSIANEIQKQKGNFGIIYALPFLSITEQVEEIVHQLNIDALTISSKSYNERIEKAQLDYETDQNIDNLNNLLVEDFIENTFDHPFIITTFVQFFETLVSNRNSTLLKLPNFSNRIFLIDEVQALPPRLYIFFTALLDAFCSKNNSYAILSTATMPNMSISIKKELNDNIKYQEKNPLMLFKNYTPPNDLLEPVKYFFNSVFNRYIISVIKEEINIKELARLIKNKNQSSLVILNTIQDTRDLFEELTGAPNLFLLNTHFTPIDRIKKINQIKELLPSEKVILISTQLIEAGVDIDFPIVYRDLCPLPNLIQSAGRCNRNGQFDFGNIFLFQLIKENGKKSSELIYRKEAKYFLQFLKENITGTIEEKDLFSIQQRFFSFVASDLEIGYYPEEEINMIECINKAQFETLGKFQLINKKSFGKEYQFYIPLNENDIEFERLFNLINTVKLSDYKEMKRLKIAINLQLKKMSGQIVSLRVIDESILPLKADEREICGIAKMDPSYYKYETGVKFIKEAYLMI